MKKVNVGIVGFGMSAKVFHVPFIQSNPSFQIIKILERKSDEAKKLYPEIETVRNLEDLLSDTDIHLIVITTPNLTHYDIAKQSLLAGKNVIIEKPFTVNTEQADELIEIAKEKKLILAVYHNRRFDGDFVTVKQILNENLLGDLVEYEAHFDRFRNNIKDNWREKDQAGSGILYDLGSHLIDQALDLFGLPETVTADIRIQRKHSKTDDNFEIKLDYKNLKVILKAGMLVKEQGPHFTLHGTKGSFIKYGLDPQEELLKKGLKPTGDSWGIESEEKWGFLNTEINQLSFKGKISTLQSSYAKFYENVYQAISNNQELIIKPEQAKEVIKVIELSIRSNHEKRTLEYK